MNKPLWVIVPAAGIGSRVGGDKPKQYQTVFGKTIIEWTIERLLDMPFVAGIVVALAKDDQWWPTLSVSNSKHVITTLGGKTRAHSVINGIKALPDIVGCNDWLLVHDAARPCVTQSEVLALIDHVKNTTAGGLLALPVADTVKKVSENNVINTLDRNRLWRALTPQMFPRQLLLQALTDLLTAEQIVTDESAAIEAQGLKPLVVKGSIQNIKVTWPEDLALAAFYLKEEAKK